MTSGSAVGGRARLGAVLSGGGLAFFVASSVANASNFLFHVVMSRLLGPESYGALGSLLGIITVVTFAAGALQAAVIQAAARIGPDDPIALRRHGWLALAVGAGALGVSSAVSPGLESFLHLRSPVPIVLLGAFVALSLMAVVPQGVLLGRLSFAVVATALVAGAVVRVGAGVVLVALGLGLDGALWATSLSAAVVLAVVLWPLRHDVLRRGDHMRIRFGPASLAAGAVGGFSALVGVDTFLARHYLPATAAGRYAAAATAARIALFMPAALALVAFPRLSVADGRGAEARRVFLRSLSSVAVLSGVSAVVMVVAPHAVIAVLFGPRYQQAAGALRVLAVAAAALGVLGLLVYAQVARGRRRALVAWGGAAAAAAAIAAFHSSMATLAWIMLAASALTLALASWGARPPAGEPSQGVGRSPGDGEEAGHPAAGAGYGDAIRPSPGPVEPCFTSSSSPSQSDPWQFPGSSQHAEESWSCRPEPTGMAEAIGTDREVAG